jgi:uncharacterized protein YndB with AHSA1/START domain
MTTPETATRSVIVEREFPYPPEKLWRALTDSSLMEQWLMKNDFEPVAGRAFNFRLDPMPNWDGVIDCEVLVVEPGKTLSYTWKVPALEPAGSAGTVVTFTLTPTDTGTRLHMEQSGFGPNQDAAYKGAGYGWQKFIGQLERVVAEIG